MINLGMVEPIALLTLHPIPRNNWMFHSLTYNPKFTPLVNIQSTPRMLGLSASQQRKNISKLNGSSRAAKVPLHFSPCQLWGVHEAKLGT